MDDYAARLLRGFLDNLWRWSAGMPECAIAEREPLTSLPELWASEWSPEFERLQRNRLVLGALRYGRLGEREKGSWDRIPAACAALEDYLETGNLENLVDAANLCMLEFVEGVHPRRHFAASDDKQHVHLIMPVRV